MALPGRRALGPASPRSLRREQARTEAPAGIGTDEDPTPTGHFFAAFLAAVASSGYGPLFWSPRLTRTASATERSPVTPSLRFTAFSVKAPKSEPQMHRSRTAASVCILPTSSGCVRSRRGRPSTSLRSRAQLDDDVGIGVPHPRSQPAPPRLRVDEDARPGSGGPVLCALLAGHAVRVRNDAELGRWQSCVHQKLRLSTQGVLG
jgi:hypothetical protein